MQVWAARSKLATFFLAFSFVRNYRSLTGPSPPGGFNFLNGVRVISISLKRKRKRNRNLPVDRVRRVLSADVPQPRHRAGIIILDQVRAFRHHVRSNSNLGGTSLYTNLATDLAIVLITQTWCHHRNQFFDISNIMWIILGHTLNYMQEFGLRNFLHVLEYLVPKYSTQVN